MHIAQRNGEKTEKIQLICAFQLQWLESDGEEEEKIIVGGVTSNSWKYREL